MVITTHLHLITLPMKMEQTVCSEMLAHKIQMPGNHPKERIEHSERRNFEVEIEEKSCTSVPPLGLHGLF